MYFSRALHSQSMDQRPFPAFVRSASPHSAPFFRCSLAFTYNDNSRQATLSLKLNLPTNSNPCFFVLEYSADIVADGCLSRENFKEQFSDHQLEELQWKQYASTDFQKLLLKIGRHCDVWCPRSPSFDFAPRCQSSFNGFKELSRASEILIYFDYNNVAKQHRGMFRAFRVASRGLAGYPLKEDLEKQGLEKMSLDDFGRKDAVNDVDPPPSLNDPPAYNEICKSPTPCDRSRQVVDTHSEPISSNAVPGALRASIPKSVVYLREDNSLQSPQSLWGKRVNI